MTRKAELYDARYGTLRGITAAALLAAAFFPGAAAAQDHGHSSHTGGRVEFPISCSAPAQLEFERAVVLLHHMTYPQAQAGFRRAAAADPACAMAHWGIAMTLFQPLWPTRPGPAELRLGADEVRQARALNPPSERERWFVDAAAAFFADPDSKDYWQRIRRWEKAMEAAHAAVPGDPEVTAFYALAHLATAPSDSTAVAHLERAAGLLLAVYERNPDHPGAMHYLVHASDAPGRERASLGVTRKYETAAPRNPHALHMPTHIHTRLGDWDAVIAGNLRAAEAALELPAGDRGQWVWDQFPHAIEYLVYAYLQRGADGEAAAQIQRMAATKGLQPSFITAFHLASTPARYALERRAWAEAAALAPREPAALDWDRFTWPEAVTWFARGLGAAHEGKLPEARAAAARLAALDSTATAAGEAIFARSIRVLHLELRAWLAQVGGDPAGAASLMREAVALELATPKHAVTPAPTIPAQELLGDLLLEQGHAAEALAEYQRSLEHYPRRFNGLLGAARAARKVGNEAEARRWYDELMAMAGSGGRASELAEARAR